MIRITDWRLRILPLGVDSIKSSGCSILQVNYSAIYTPHSALNKEPGRLKITTELRLCTRCVLPETFPGINFDDKGCATIAISALVEEKLAAQRDVSRARFEQLLRGSARAGHIRRAGGLEWRQGQHIHPCAALKEFKAARTGLHVRQWLRLKAGFPQHGKAVGQPGRGPPHI